VQFRRRSDALALRKRGHSDPKLQRRKGKRSENDGKVLQRERGAKMMEKYCNIEEERK
jgi:hypothetical protein